jgi:hypothetical protein
MALVNGADYGVHLLGGGGGSQQEQDQGARHEDWKPAGGAKFPGGAGPSGVRTRAADRV